MQKLFMTTLQQLFNEHTMNADDSYTARKEPVSVHAAAAYLFTICCNNIC